MMESQVVTHPFAAIQAELKDETGQAGSLDVTEKV